MEDTRYEARSLMQRLEFSSTAALLKIGVCLLLATAAFWATGGATVSDAAR